MTTNIDMQALRNDAVEIFNHGFACSESVITQKNILTWIYPTMPLQ